MIEVGGASGTSDRIREAAMWLRNKGDCLRRRRLDSRRPRECGEGRRFWGPGYPRRRRSTSSGGVIGVMTSSGPQMRESAISREVPAVRFVLTKMNR